MSQTSEKIDLFAWLRKKDAAERIGCSEKHVEKLSREGSLEMQMYRRPEGGPRVAVYHPGDVEKLAGQKNPNGHVMKPADSTDGVPIIVPTTNNPLSTMFTSGMIPFLRTLSGLSETAETSDLPPSELRFVGYLSIMEAMDFTGLPEKTLQRFAKEGRIGKIGTKYRRKDLEGL